ncbi:MAG TPA: hypothetical protein VFS49_01275 [Croceibacterium sp.]|nr:hypothetical protein [Croceibacterium sp.]
MRSKTFASALALPALALAAPTFASVTEFRLPGERPQQPPPTDVQGPVAPDVPASRRVRAQPEPTPAPAASREEAPIADPAAPRVEMPTGLQPAPDTSRSAEAPASATRRPAATATAQASAGQPPPSIFQDTPGPASRSPDRSRAVTTAGAPPPGDAGWSWLWLLAVPAAVGALLLALRAARRRPRRQLAAAAAPSTEAGRAVPPPVRPAPPPSLAVAEPLQLSLEPLRLALTLMNATLSYRLELTNRGPAAVTGLTIGADMISAHASLSREEQLSGPSTADGAGNASRQHIERLEPGESRLIDGEFRLPFPQIVPIRQGDAALLLPLARFRVEAEGSAPVVRTFAIGQPGHRNGLQPFRLDQGPRIYPRLTQHAFA